MKRFEYLKKLTLSEAEINKFGEEGWELISVVDRLGLIYFFKRELSL